MFAYIAFYYTKGIPFEIGQILSDFNRNYICYNTFNYSYFNNLQAVFDGEKSFPPYKILRIVKLKKINNTFLVIDIWEEDKINKLRTLI